MELSLKKILTCLLPLFILMSYFASASNKISIEHDHSADGFARIKVTNKTNVHLACYVSIDGHKAKFTLRAQRPSRWYQATDKRFNASSFSTWCDNLQYYPNYQKYVKAI